MYELESDERPREEGPHMPNGLAKKMSGQGYHFVGKHSATKICGYTKSSLKGGHACYKNTFYGIQSWRCIQATPAIGCNLACTFCWRIIPEEEGYSWNEINAVDGWDDPSMIVEGLISEHRKIISGYRGNKSVTPERWSESNDPAHVALSLTGEPLFYPKMNELITEFHKRGISTFLVTNGTMLNALKRLRVMPTQLYVSIQAPNEELYNRITRPKSLNASWQGLHRFLEVFSTMDTRRVFRLTLIRNLNLTDPEGYANLIKVGKPHYVELKGFVYVGGARNSKRNLSYDQMPVNDEILEFAKMVAGASGYIISDYDSNSKVALLCVDEAAAENRKIHFDK
ncbi:MAG: 4-demethylwyosine synthase TYW1 [Candidatus Marsarchaeota archaeon]|jgi:tRNA wybutosine-synthesizing protein 1|nr:4-demethylwyosine synthase TYW1 [Candidatus Marsarchaeota archaeon]